MRNKKTILIGGCLLAAFVVLGVAYAISTIDMTINGTLSVAPASDSAFDVRFETTNASRDVEGISTSTAGIDAEDTTRRTGTMSVSFTSTAAVDSTQSAMFTIKNYSQAGVSAKITKSNIKIYASDGTTPYTSNHFEVSVSGIDGTEAVIPSNGTKEITVSVRLKTAHIGDDDFEESFVIKLEGISAQETNS